MNVFRRCRVDTAVYSTHIFYRSLCSMTPPSLTAQVVLKKEKSHLIEEMNPFVYSHSIQSTIPYEIHMGEECFIKDSHGNVLGRGVYNPNSLYRVRMLALASECTEENINLLSLQLSQLIKYRLLEAKILRNSIIGLPNADTSVYRLVNGEGDRLSGLVVDVFNEEIIVVQSSAAWTEKYRFMIESTLQNMFSYTNASIVWLPMSTRLQQEGWISDISEESSCDGDVSNEKSSDCSIRVMENGLSYQVFPGNGQKTGFYCDQRDNRRQLQRFCQGKNVLDLFCHSGGFSLNALVGEGARSIVAVDSSEEALKAFLSNLHYNFKESRTNNENIITRSISFIRNDEYTPNTISEDNSSDTVTFVKADVNSFLKKIHKHNKTCATNMECLLFDVVICDPPKLAPKKTFIKKAMNKYVKVNSAAMRVLRPGGLLLTCSCSTVIAQEPHSFTQILRAAGREAGKSVTVISTSSAGMDHPLNAGYSDGKHLTVVLARIT